MKMARIEITSDAGMVWIEQTDDCGESALISLYPEQIALVCEWLEQAKKQCDAEAADLSNE